MKKSLLFLILSLSCYAQATIDLSTITESEVQQSWQTFFKEEPEASDQLSTYPWQELAELNIFAAKTWDMMRNCENSSHQVIERIKERYKNNEAFCNPEINKNLQQLHDSFYSLAATTSIGYKTVGPSIRYFHSIKSSPFAINHPLFIQVVTEVLSTRLRFQKIEASYFSTLFNAKMDHLINNNLGLPMNEYSTVKVITNSAYFLAVAPQEDCQSWGLWPLKAYYLSRSWKEELPRLISQFSMNFHHDLRCQLDNQEKTYIAKQQIINFYRLTAKAYGYQTPAAPACRGIFCHIEDPATPGELKAYSKFMNNEKSEIERWAKYDEYHSDHKYLVCGCPCMEEKERLKKCDNGHMNFEGFMESFKR